MKYLICWKLDWGFWEHSDHEHILNTEKGINNINNLKKHIFEEHLIELKKMHKKIPKNKYKDIKIISINKL